MLNMVPPYYGADDLLLQELYNEGCRICNNKPIYTTPEQADTFESANKKSKVKKGLKIGGIAAGIITSALLIGKFILKKGKGKV